VLVNVTSGSFFSLLEILGLNSKSLREIREWAKERSVTLRFKASEKCDFNRETKRDVESDTKYVREYAFGGKAKTTDKVVTTVTEYFWDFECSYELFVFVGNEPDEKVVLQSRSCKYEAMTTSKENPRNTAVIRDPMDVNLTWLLNQLEEGNRLKFQINREAAR
jgi:hypothetical protein